MGLLQRIGAQLNPFDQGRTFSAPQGPPPRPPTQAQVNLDALVRAMQQQARSNPAQANALAAQIRATGTNATPTYQQAMAPTSLQNRIIQPLVNRGVQNAMNSRGLAPILTGLGRSGSGTAEGLAGLYDLVTPGLGNNRFTKGAKGLQEQADQQMKAGRYNQALYKGGQLAGDTATFLAAGAPFTKGAAEATSLVSKLPGAGNVARAVDLLAEGGKGSKVAADALRWLGNPGNLSNIASGALTQTGQRTARGGKVNAGTVAQDLAMNAVKSIATGFLAMHGN